MLGEARRRRGKFLEAHPVCCFCGGVKAATTVDHIPSRDCFKGRAFPEEFEFPACEGCQALTAKDEQVFSFVVQMVDRNPSNYDRAKARRAIQGIKNNFPHLAPGVIDDPKEKFRALAHLGQPIPVLTPAVKIPLVTLPLEIRPHIDQAARKLLLALYYKELGQIVGPGFRIWLSWNFASDLRAMESILEVAKMARFRTVGFRRNVQFGDQFGYRWDRSEPPDKDDLFMFVAQFGQGMVVTGLLADEHACERMIEAGDDPKDWTKASF